MFSLIEGPTGQSHERNAVGLVSPPEGHGMRNFFASVQRFCLTILGDALPPSIVEKNRSFRKASCFSVGMFPARKMRQFAGE
jgi:hypothetical protein